MPGTKVSHDNDDHFNIKIVGSGLVIDDAP